MRPAEGRARCGNFPFPERRAVDVGGPRLVRRALADDRATADELRPAVLRAIGFRRDDCRIDGGHVMAVDVPLHVPAVRRESLRGVVGEPALRLAVDRDPVVVVEHDELAETPRSGERGGLMGNAFHQAAVADERVRVVIDDRMTRTVEFARQQPFRERHSDRVREPLPERAGRRLHAWRDPVLRVPGRLRMKLTKALQLVDRQIVAGEMQQAVEEHRAVAVRQHEAVAIGPRRMGRMVTQVAAPERKRDLGHSHRHSGMP